MEHKSHLVPDTRSEREKSYDKPDPETPINIPRTAKKEVTIWIVRGVCLVACMGLAAIARLWADDRYTQKIDFSVSVSTTAQKMDEEQKKREALEASNQEIKEKLNLIIYILQHDGTLKPNEMKGKLSTP